MKLTKPLVIFDLETTGTWVEKDKIVEIGMVKLMPDGARSSFIKRVNPGMPIPVNVSRIIDIKDEDVKDAPKFKDTAQEALEFLADSDGALLTRYPDGLASALQKIGAHSIQMKKVSHATAHLFIANPFGPKALSTMDRLFMTHPPIEARIQALLGSK